MYIGLSIVSVHLLLLPYFSVNKDYQQTDSANALFSESQNRLSLSKVYFSSTRTTYVPLFRSADESAADRSA